MCQVLLTGQMIFEFSSMDLVCIKDNIVHGISCNSLKSGKLEDLESEDDNHFPDCMLIIKIYEL